MNIETGVRRTVLTLDGAEAHWSPTGDRFVVAGPNESFLYDLDGQQLRVFSGPSQLRWSSDGNWVCQRGDYWNQELTCYDKDGVFRSAVRAPGGKGYQWLILR